MAPSRGIKAATALTLAVAMATSISGSSAHAEGRTPEKAAETLTALLSGYGLEDHQFADSEGNLFVRIPTGAPRSVASDIRQLGQVTVLDSRYSIRDVTEIQAATTAFMDRVDVTTMSFYDADSDAYKILVPDDLQTEATAALPPTITVETGTVSVVLTSSDG